MSRGLCLTPPSGLALVRSPTWPELLSHVSLVVSIGHSGHSYVKVTNRPPALSSDECKGPSCRKGQRQIAMPEFHRRQIPRENRQPANMPGARALPDGSLLHWGPVQLVRIFRQDWEDGTNLDTPGKPEPQLKLSIRLAWGNACGSFSSLLIDVEDPSPMWVLQSLGCWAWAI